MDDLVFKTVLLRGAQGEKGDPGTADAMPSDGVIAYDGETVPEGYEEAAAPTGVGVSSFNGRAGAVTPQAGDYSKGDVGLSNVDNTSDADKPISTATQTALNGKVDKVEGKSLSTNDFTDTYKNYTIIAYNANRRERKDISSNLSNLLMAISEQNLEKYGYSIGDYFTGADYGTGSANTYHLADMDTFYGGYSNYAVVNTHHCAIVVDANSTSKWMDGTVSTYGASTLHSYLSGSVLSKAKLDMISFFGGSTGLEHLIANNKLFAGIETWTWSSSPEYISALTEVQIYGCPIWSADHFQQGEAVKKLKLFDKYRFNEIFRNQWHWLRSLSSASGACYAADDGGAGGNDVGRSGGVSGLILLH